jgi:hypothetical protein
LKGKLQLEKAKSRDKRKMRKLENGCKNEINLILDNNKMEEKRKSKMKIKCIRSAVRKETKQNGMEPKKKLRVNPKLFFLFSECFATVAAAFM